MSSYLHVLGGFVARHATRTLLVWAAVLVLVGALAGALGGQLQDDLSIPGTESQSGLDTLHERFPEVAGTNGQIVFRAPAGHRISEYRPQVDHVLDRVRHVDHVERAADPFSRGPGNNPAVSVSKDGRAALVQVQLDIPLDRLQDRTVTDLKHAVDVPGSPVETHLGGAIFTHTKVSISPTEGIGVVLALIVLVITFGSLLAAGMPIITALLGVAVAMSGVLSVAAVTSVNSSTPTLALMIGLAVGIDYALFIVSRHRAELVRGVPVVESIARSLATAGSAVIFAGVTVIIALCGLVVAGIPFLAMMGYAAALAVAVAVVVALTVVPALLALAGERLRPKPGSRAARNAVVEPGQSRTLGARWVRLVTRVPALTAVVTVGVLIALALPAKDLALALTDTGSAPRGSTQRTTYDLIDRQFGPGYNGPLLVTADIIRTTKPVAVTHGLARDLAKLPGVAAVGVATPNPTADLAIVQVIPSSSPTSPATADLVREIRTHRSGLEHTYDVTQLTVTGQTAANIDVSDRLSGALVPFGGVVLGLSILLLMVVFRSIAVPLKATLGYLLSVGASFGAVTAVFQWGWLAGPLGVDKLGPVLSFLPIILMGVLFGLAMDYEVFLVSRMREAHVKGTPSAVASGFTSSARVVTAAAVIMISVFAAFVPEGDMTIKPMALGLAVGVFVDAFLVRMTLVPAVLALLGDRAWWLPRWLDRRLPVLDVEGTGVEARLEHQAWASEHGAAVVRAEGVRLDQEPVSFVVRPGELAAIVSDDQIERRALLAALTGRYDVEGRLVVLEHPLPSESGMLRRAVALWERFPTYPQLQRLHGQRLVVVDGLDESAGPDEIDQRWRALAELADSGTTVVAGVGAEVHVPDHAHVVRLPRQAEEVVL